MRGENLRVTIAGTDGCELLPELERHASDKVIVKKRYIHTCECPHDGH
jgi:hypothetical protein